MRITPKGSVIVSAGGQSLRGRVVNLSTGGLLVEMSAPIGAPADLVAIELRLDGASGEWLRMSARVMRASEDASLALAFMEPSRELADIMLTLSGDWRVLDRRISVVLIDSTTARRNVLAEAFRAAGCVVIDVETPLAAIAELGGADFEPDLIAIADSATGISEDLREFVRREHSGVKLVRIGDDAIEPVGLAHWLSTANPADDLLTRIRRLLGAQP